MESNPLASTRDPGVRFAVSMLLVLLLPGIATAQAENRIGIYTTAAAGGTSQVAAPFTPFDAYFVLTTPRTAAGDVVTACDGFEFRVFVWPCLLSRLSDTTNPDWSNTEDATDPCTARYRVNGPTPVPVNADMLVLQVWHLMVWSAGEQMFYVAPLENPTVPGRMAYFHPGTSGSVAEGAMAVSGSFDSPVYAVNWSEPVEGRSFGAVKALYR